MNPRLQVMVPAEHADRVQPEELVAEGRPCRGVEHEVADIDEAADRSKDSERNLEDLHFESLSARSADQSLRYGRWMTTVAGSGIVRLSEAPTRSSVAGSTPAAK